MSKPFSFPLYLPGLKSEDNLNQTLLVVDLRAKLSCLSTYSCENGKLTKISEKIYETDQFVSFSELVEKYIKEVGKTFNTVAVAVPGPVVNGKCETPNLPWTVDQSEVQKKLGIKSIYLVNDLEAVAYSLADLEAAKIEILHDSTKKVKGNVAVLASGNGLGEAGLFWDGEYLRPFATEGGHTEFSPRNDFEVEFYQFLNKIYGIVTWENVLSKDGLYNIFRFLRDIGRHKEEAWLSEKLSDSDFLEVMAEVGKEKKSRLVNLTLEMYSEFLARECNSLALKLKSTGGLVITGEISDKIFDLFDKSKFYKDFMISDRMQHLLKDIPIYIIKDPNAILDGAAYYGAFFES